MLSEHPKDLTMFGQWLTTLRNYVGEEDWKEVARRADLHTTTISHTTRSGESNNRPSRQTVAKLLQALRSLAEERGRPWPPEVQGVSVELYVFHVAGFAADQEISTAEQMLRPFQQTVLKEPDS